MSDRDYLPGGARAARAPAPGDRPARALSVLVVGYRRPDLLARCLASVEQHLPGHRVLVWDNTGDDAPGRAEVVAAHPGVEWQLSASNVGFAAAVNALAERAGDDDLLLLNPDAVLTGPLTGTREALTHRDVAAAAPLVTDERAGRAAWDVAHRRNGLTRALVAHSGYASRLRRTPLSDLYPAPPTGVDGYLTGGCLAISRAAWDAVGPFDEEFFLYGEEADWQARARAAGWRLTLTGERGAAHAGHGTVTGDPSAARRSQDLLRANIALALEHERGVHTADAYLAGTSLLDRAQRSTRRTRTSRPRPARPGVVLTINRLGFGGAERHHVLLAAELQRRGHDVVIACMQRLGPLVREVAPDVRVVRQPWWAPAVDLGTGPAVVISGDTNTETGFAALWRRAGRNRRWLAAAHIPPDPHEPTYGRALAAAMSTADGFVALSPAHVDEVSAHQRVARRMFVAPNGVPAGAPDLARPRAPGRPLQLVMLSRIVEAKNPHLLVAALAGLSDPHWELSIFGDGPDRARLEALTPGPLRSRVHWGGWSPGPDDAFRDCDLVCIPSGTEAFPLVVVEAMARGLPVLASAVCSVPDMLEHGRAGLLVDDVTVEGWRAALREALSDPEKLPAIGTAGQTRMRELYTVEAMTDAYETAIDAVLTGRGVTGVRVLWLSPWLRSLARVQVEALIEHGHEVLLVTSDRHPEPDGVRPYELELNAGPKDPRSWRPTLAAARRIRRFAPDVVLDELVRDPRWTAFAPGVPRLTLVHDDRPHGADEQRPRWERALFDRRARSAQGTVAFSEYVAGQLRTRGAPAVRVVPLTSDLPDDAVPPASDDRHDFVLAGRLRGYKNLDVALAAWRRHVDGPAWTGDELLLVGEGPTPGLPPHARHLNGPFRYADVVLLLARAKGSLVHYRQASQSGVQVLSMQLGVTPIVSPCGALPEFQAAGMPPIGVDDVAGLAARLDELARPGTAHLEGERAREHYRSHFAVDAIVSRWVDVLTEVARPG